MESENDIISYRKSVQRQRVHIFLAGLDDDFQQIRSEILRKDPILGLDECYSMICRESIQQTTMNGEPEKIEASAMVSRNKKNPEKIKQHQFRASVGANKSDYKCIHCDQLGHTKDRFFELVGYPDWWDHNRDLRMKRSGKAPTTAVVETKVVENIIEKPSVLAVTGNNGHPNEEDDWIWYQARKIILPGFGAKEHEPFASGVSCG